jgi:regulator of protease activity HflC (stomatin/prohibitin superfamily)
MTFWSLLGLVLVVIVLAAGLSRIVERTTVFEYQHAIRFVRGRFAGVIAPGIHWSFRPFTAIQILEARPRVITIAGQEVLSSDGVALKASLLLEVRISDPKLAALESASYEQSLYAKAQAALRIAIGEKPIEDVLRSRGELSDRLVADVEPAARALGLELRSISIKDLMFAGTLKEAFSQTARAKQEAQAALERARGESAALRNLANAARLLENNPNLFQLRLLQAASEGGKIVINLTPPDAGAKTVASGAERSD